MYQSNNINRGFSLVELLVSIAILGVVTSVVLVAINPAKRLAQGRDSKRISDLKQIGNALKAYYTENSAYPEATCTYNGWERSEVVGVQGDCNGNKAEFMEYLKEEKWLKTVPVDPLHPKDNPLWGYLYQSSSDLESFCLLAHLEDNSNSILSNDADCDDDFNETWWYAISSERK